MGDPTTIKDLYDWINAGGLPPSTVLYLDGDGTLMADLPDKAAATYLHIGFSECDEPEEAGRTDGDELPDDIEGTPGLIGHLVFWGDRRPRWIVEWQPDNGRSFVVVDADGNVGVAAASELTRDFRKAGGK